MKTRYKTGSQAIIRVAESPDAPWRWRWQPAQGEAQEGYWQAHAPQHNLPDASAAITLLLPAGRFLFCPVQFSGRLKRDAQALLWSLEAFALGEVEQLHVTPLLRVGDNCHLAVLEKRLLSGWLTQLAGWGLQPERALPDVLALPADSAILLDNDWLVRSGDTAGFTAGEQEVALLQLTPAIHCYSPLPSGVEGWYQEPLQPPMALLMQGTTSSRCNLLHGEFAPARPRGLAPSWRLPLTLAACLALTFPAESLWLGWQAQRKAASLQQQAAALYQRAFPQAAVPEKPRQQLEQRIAELTAALPRQGLLALLAEGGPLLNALPPGSIQSLTWNGSRLTLLLALPEAELQPLLEKHRPPALSLATDVGNNGDTRLHLTRGTL